MMEEELNYNPLEDVYTTIQVMEGSPVVYAYHDYEGDWRFFGSETLKKNDTVQTPLGLLLSLHPDIEEILHHPIGTELYRADAHSPWVILEDDEESAD